MSSTIVCNQKQQKFKCRMIVDGERYGEWDVSTLDLDSPRDVDMRTQVEGTTKEILASTGEYFDCNEEKGALKCTGTDKKPEPIVKEGERKERGIWDRLLGR